MFRPAFHCEDWLGVAHDDDHFVVRWEKAPVFFSCCRKGNAISAHFSAAAPSVRLLKEAIEEYCRWAFECLPWCRIILACIVKPSVIRLVKKCGFNYLETHGDLQIYMRVR